MTAETMGTAATAASELFFEIGSEELPAQEVVPAVEFLRDTIVAGLDERALAHGEARIYATPRRLTLIVPGVATRQLDVVKESLGPPESVAFKEGKPTKAAEGFAKGLGLTVADLFVKETPKGRYLAARVEEKGKAALELLPELLRGTIGKIPFKRLMRWAEEEETYCRPILWIAALFGGEVVRLRYAGVDAGRTSRGHRFLAPEPFEVASGAEYIEALAARSVIPDVAARRAEILRQAEALAASVGGRLRVDEGLFDEVTQLVELPVAMCTAFDRRYLEIPKEVLISEMRTHQRYLSIVDEHGALLPYFVVVANTRVKDPEVSKSGYRRVLTARFEDGAFFFAEDQKTPLLSRLERLATIAYHRKLGTVRDKIDRIANMTLWLARELGPQLPGAPSIGGVADPFATAAGAMGATGFTESLLRAAYLAKADLATSMVFEFPELQGTMGRAYAEKAGERPEVALAIEEHYLPRHAGDRAPSGILGALVGLGDRFDTIAGIFSVGKGPTGAADPFGLRRAALGIIHILSSFGLHLSIDRAVDAALAGLKGRRDRDEAEVRAEVLEFFRARLANQLAPELGKDTVEAALAPGADDLVDARARAVALAAIRRRPDFEPLSIAFKRVANILKGQSPGEVTLAELGHDAERGLFEAASAAEAEVRALVVARRFDAALGRAAELRPAVDAFFAAVMVMDEDPAVRGRRLALVRRAERVFAPLADFTRLS